MNFILKLPKSTDYSVSLCANPEELKSQTSGSIKLHISGTKVLNYKKIENSNGVFYIIGDFIIPKAYRKTEEKYLADFFSNFAPKNLRNAPGNFYIIFVDKTQGVTSVYNSFLSILPVYFFENGKETMISSRMDSILTASEQTFKINRKYILEHLLFGYSFQNSTLFKDIRLLQSNHFLEIKAGKSGEISHTNISDYFVKSPEPWKKDLETLSKLLVERVEDYLPDEAFFLSLTGGLDGRTLLAVSLHNQKQVSTYSYGSEHDKDVTIPAFVSEKIGIPYQPFLLGKEYAEKEFLNHAKSAGVLSEGNIRFSRATYHYFSEKLSEKTKYTVSGNFGSELMRTMRMPGNVISHIIFDMFETESDKDFAEKIRLSPKLRYIDLSGFKDEMEELINDCLYYRHNLDRSLSLNQQFYKYLFEEIFRKYFGPELIVENHYLVNRTPFLDFRFMKELFHSQLAGCNGEYRVSNPFSRFKGQALYPHVIKKTWPDLLKYKLDRNYSPEDFLSYYGYAKIFLGFYLRKLKVGNKKYNQPSYGELAFSKNLADLKKIPCNYPFVSKIEFNQLFVNSGWKSDHINFNIYLSFFHHLDYLLKTHANVEFE